jgi:hypothetical protein
VVQVWIREQKVPRYPQALFVEPRSRSAPSTLTVLSLFQCKMSLKGRFAPNWALHNAVERKGRHASPRADCLDGHRLAFPRSCCSPPCWKQAAALVTVCDGANFPNGLYTNGIYRVPAYFPCHQVPGSCLIKAHLHSFTQSGQSYSKGTTRARSRVGKYSLNTYKPSGPLWLATERTFSAVQPGCRS